MSLGGMLPDEYTLCGQQGLRDLELHGSKPQPWASETKVTSYWRVPC